MTHMQMFGQAYQADTPDVRPVFVLLFDTAWRFFRFGYASAMGVALTLVILLVTRVLFAFFDKRVEY
jgi:ABC-type sugar transport system permease subunit